MDPLEEGTSPSQVLEAAPAPVAQSASSPALSLTDLSRDSVLFSHGLFFTYGCLRHDPLSETSCRTRHVLLSRPVFQGMGADFLDHSLWLCPREDWETLSLHLILSAGIWREEDYYWRALLQRLPLLDLEGRRLVASSFVEIAVLGIDSNRGIWATEPAVRPFDDRRLRVVGYPASADTVILGQAILSGSPHPFAAVETDREGQDAATQALRGQGPVRSTGQ